MIFSARCGSAPMRPMSQTPVPAASASSPGDLNGTYFIGTPRREAISPARSGATPWGSPVALLPVTSKKFERLMPARSTPVGASSETISGDIEGVRSKGGESRNKCGRHPMLARSSEAIAVNLECRGAQCPLLGVKRTFVLRVSVSTESWLTSGMAQHELAGRTGRLACPALEGMRKRTSLTVADESKSAKLALTE